MFHINKKIFHKLQGLTPTWTNIKLTHGSKQKPVYTRKNYANQYSWLIILVEYNHSPAPHDVNLWEGYANTIGTNLCLDR